MPERDADVYPIILNYQTPELTRNAVRSLLASCLRGARLHPVIVDNGSSDRSAERLSDEFPCLPVLRSERNLGFAGGNNIGLKWALEQVSPEADRSRTFILLLNSDVELEPHALQICLDFMHANPDVGVVGPKVVLADGRLDLACRRSFPTPASGFWKLTGLARRFPNNPRFARYNLTYLDEDETADVDSVVGAFMLVRLTAIDAAGLLDDSFFMYGEDLDWAYRIKAHGWRVVYYPRAKIVHLKGATTRRQPYRMIFEFYRAMWLFHRKHYADHTLPLINWLIIAGIAARGAIALVVNASRPDGQKRVA